MWGDRLLQKILIFLSSLINRFIKQDVTDANANAQRYLQKELFNALSVLSRKIARKVMSQSEINVTGESPRALYLDVQVQRFMDDSTLAVTRMCGTGGVMLKPNTNPYDDEIYVSILPQTRFVPIEMLGKRPISGYFAADIAVVEDKEYYRLELHKIELDADTYSIKQIVFDGEKVVPLAVVPQWASMEEEQRITNVDRMLFGFLRCPTDDKKETPGYYGVPLDYGSDRLAGMIIEQISRIDSEFSKKESWIGIDQRLFDKSGKIPNSEDKMFKILAVGGKKDETFWQEFSPEIRNDPLTHGLTTYLALYEKSSGVSQGIMTELEGSAATATEIRQRQGDTFDTVDDIRVAFQAAVGDLVYAMDVIANVNNITPLGDYELAFNWDDSMKESSTERWTQLKDGVSIGANDVSEARAWSMNEDPATAKENTAKIITMAEAGMIVRPELYLMAKDPELTEEQAAAMLPEGYGVLGEMEQ